MKEIIDFLKKYTDGKKNIERIEISVLQLNRVIKALEKEPILDKIRVEIEEYRDSLPWESDSISLVKWDAINYILEQIIDKYRESQEGEDKE